MPVLELQETQINHIQHHIQIVKKYLAGILACTTHGYSEEYFQAEKSIRLLETYFKIE